MITIPETTKEMYKEYDRQLSVYGVLYLANKEIVNNEVVISYTPFNLTEENECKILSFNINEKTDVYYTSLPYNTMIIEVDNEKGYFTDYDPDSIVNRLNTECYVDLFIKINEDDYYKIMTMKFDKISSSDYEKAKLSFKSNISLLKTLPLRDKYNNLFIQRDVYKNTLINYMKDNYNIDLICDNTNNVVIADIVEQNTNSVENLLLQAGTRYGDLSNAVLTLNDSQDRIVQRTWKAEEQDLITRDLQLEKAIIKREDNYRGVHRKYSNVRQWDFNSTETFNLTINGKLNSSSDTIVLRNNLYKINDITASDITSTGLTSLTVNQNGPYEILIININGNIGSNYEIVINKSNIVKKTSDSYVEEDIGNIDDTTKVLNITENAPLLSNYYNLILLERQIKSNIEVRAMGLPYLEVGDTIEVETELAKILMTISELDMNYDGGLTMTVKGYELGWDALFPADDLYPSNNLYPNTPIN